jgi:HK97 family phage prohead protease
MDKSYDFKFNFPIQLKADNSGQFYLEGYACTTDLDRQDEVILRTALEKALEDVKQNRTVFYEHKSTEYPIGKIVDTKIVDEGDSSKLYVKVYISKTAEIVRTLIEEGILNKFSIGGKVLKYKKASMGGKEITEIQDMELYEVSVVGLPANVKAEAIGYEVKKSLGLNLEKKEDVKLEKSAEDLKKEEEVAKALEIQKQKEAEELKAAEIKKAEELKAAEELKKAEELKAAEDLKKAEEVKTAEAKRIADEKKKAEELQVLDAKEVMDALGRMEAMIQEMAAAIKAQKVEVKKEETPKEIKASVNMEEVDALIKKAVESVKEELLKVVKTSGRKGLVIQESIKDEVHKEETPEDNDSLEVLENETEFNKKTPEEKTKIIREGFLKILKKKVVED